MRSCASASSFHRRRSGPTRAASTRSPRRSRSSDTTTCSRTTTCSARISRGGRTGPARTRPSTSSTRSSSSSGISRRSCRRSSWSPECSCFLSGRRRWSPSRLPRSTSSPAGTSGSASGSGGTSSSSRHSGGLLEPGPPVGGADRGPASPLDGAGRGLRGTLAPNPVRRDQPAPRPAPDPDLDRRVGRGGDQAHCPPRRRLLPAAPVGGRLAGDDRAAARLGGGGRPRSRLDWDRAAHPGRRGDAGRLACGPEEWRELGATHLSVATMRGGLDADGHIRRIAEAIEAIRS
jgi:hypothetical protein